MIGKWLFQDSSSPIGKIHVSPLKWNRTGSLTANLMPKSGMR